MACLGMAIQLKNHPLSDQRKQLRRTRNYLAYIYRHLRDNIPLDGNVKLHRDDIYI